jgi:hypothetical protein
MKRLIFSAALLASMTAMAQETYTNAELFTEDLNGTARYVGMGGAMEALGADMSTINTNPAGVGLFRRSAANFSVGVVSQQDAGQSSVGDATRLSFDQVGFVWCTNPSRWNTFNIAFNYKKNRNFSNILNVAGSLDGQSSQNANSYMNLMDAYSADPDGDWLNSYKLSQLDAMYYKTFVGDQDENMYYNSATGYGMTRTTKGYVGEYSVNVSGNVSNRVYLGMTIGFCDVNYRSWTSYSESLINGDGDAIGDITVNDQREITGTGFNVKLGTVIFPVEENPFRIGLYVSTPTWYDLRSYSNTYLTNNANTGGTPKDPSFESKGDYEYRVYTPWKFGLALGHTVSNYLALGATYEFSDYSNMSNRVIDGYDYYGDATSYKDADMNDHTQKTLKGVSTLKVGAEVKPTPEFAVRLGYNYVSPMYRTEAFRDGTISSLGTYYSSTTDYTNWKATNRITCGLGYSKGSFAVDLAYQYSATDGEFHPFTDSNATYTWDDGTEVSVINHADGVNVSNKRHQVLATFTYKF